MKYKLVAIFFGIALLSFYFFFNIGKDDEEKDWQSKNVQYHKPEKKTVLTPVQHSLQYSNSGWSEVTVQKNKWQGPSKGFDLLKAKNIFDLLLAQAKSQNQDVRELAISRLPLAFYQYEFNDAQELAARYFEYKFSLHELENNLKVSDQKTFQNFMDKKSEMKMRVWEEMQIQPLISDETEIDSYQDAAFKEIQNNGNGTVSKEKINQICELKQECESRLYTVFDRMIIREAVTQ